ncbi:MAG: patatin [Gammaproteobacteria bacterium]|nr:patatin [Gammaproteobacteria bacterium]
MKTCRALLSMALLLASFHAQAERPKIGLALAGGGAKGSAHIAVIEILEANNIPIDYIAGTSIGAYVGGLYALGYSGAEIRKIMYNAQLERGFSDTIDRAKLQYRDKRVYDKFNVGLQMGYRNREIRFPWGLLYGQSMSAAFRRSVGNIPNFDSFDDLAIPFRAVATDLATNKAVVLGKGNLIKSMKASATVPGALVPVVLDGKYLVDGGMAANLPVSQVREMGADIIIALDISAPMEDVEEIRSALSVLNQISSFLTVKNLEEQKELLSDDDIYIRPRVEDLETADFSDLTIAYDRGKVAAEEQLQRLQKLSIDAQQYQRYQQRKRDKLDTLIEEANQPVARIILSNRSNYNKVLILDALALEAGVVITTEELLAAVGRVYSLDRFELVDAFFEQRAEGRVLIVEVVEKSWGPNYFDLGLGFEHDFSLNSVINLDIAYTLGHITNNKGEWRNELGLGTDSSFRSELYLPIDQAQRFYGSVVYEFRREGRNFFKDNEREFVIDFDIHQLDFSLGYKLNVAAVVESGLILEQGDINNEVVLGDKIHYKSPGVFISYGYDTLDRLSFPSRGSQFKLVAIQREEDVEGDPIFDNGDLDEDYATTQYLMEWKAAVTKGNHGVVGQASFTYLDSEEDRSVHYAQLGGFLNLSGYHSNALVGNNKVFGSIAYQYNLGRRLFNLTRFPIYVGGSLEKGNVWEASDSIKYDELITAGSIFISTDTNLGPVALAYGIAESGNSAVYFYLGKHI